MIFISIGLITGSLVTTPGTTTGEKCLVKKNNKFKNIDLHNVAETVSFQSFSLFLLVIVLIIYLLRTMNFSNPKLILSGICLCFGFGTGIGIITTIPGISKKEQYKIQDDDGIRDLTYDDVKLTVGLGSGTLLFIILACISYFISFENNNRWINIGIYVILLALLSMSIAYLPILSKNLKCYLCFY
jgi:ABC-type Fe3+-siderophore transport system permease subunit